MHETQPVLLWKVNINMSFLENEIIELLRTCDAFMAVIQFSSVAQSCPTLVPKFMSIELVMPSNHLILYCSLLFLPSVIPSIRVFSNESPLHIGSQSIGVSFSFLFFSVLFIYLFLLYNIVLVLPYIDMNPPWVSHPEPPSHLPPHPIPLGHPNAPAPNTLPYIMHQTWTGDSFHM